MDLSRDRKVPLFTDEALSPGPSRPLSSSSHPFHIQDETLSPHELPGPYRVYKRRWFGLAQLSLLNLIVSWDWLTFAPVASTSAEYYDVSISAVNWLSTAFLFAFVVAAPVVMLVLNKGGPKPATVACSALILVGNWLRYAGTRARPHGSSGGIFGLVMAGQILIGLVGVKSQEERRRADDAGRPNRLFWQLRRDTASSGSRKTDASQRRPWHPWPTHSVAPSVN